MEIKPGSEQVDSGKVLPNNEMTGRNARATIRRLPGVSTALARRRETFRRFGQPSEHRQAESEGRQASPTQLAATPSIAVVIGSKLPAFFQLIRAHQDQRTYSHCMLTAAVFPCGPKQDRRAGDIKREKDRVAEADKFVSLDGCIRRRIRMCCRKHWRRPRTKVRNLVRLSVILDIAIKHAISRKSDCRLSCTPAMR